MITTTTLIAFHVPRFAELSLTTCQKYAKQNKTCRTIEDGQYEKQEEQLADMEDNNCGEISGEMVIRKIETRCVLEGEIKLYGKKGLVM